MDSFSTAYDFTMLDDVADFQTGDTAETVPLRLPALFGIERLLDGLDVVSAVYEPAAR